jgi:O-antigen/teichoic acid export membrane protein
MFNLKLLHFLQSKCKTQLFQNSFWGIFSNIFQNILFSVFFIVIARKYNTNDFSNYILANTLYGFVLAFSSLGLGQWFIRALMTVQDKVALVYQFFKIQLLVGFVFYLVNIAIAFTLYTNPVIRNLSLLIGVNLIFDNIIYVIKYVNIAEFNQKRTFVILTIEALLKFIAALAVLYLSISIIQLAAILILLRFITLHLFLRFGSIYHLGIGKLIHAPLNKDQFKKIVIANWTFVVIGSISVVYWKVGTILISKLLTASDVANYEISFKLFALAQILPVIVSTSIFPILVKQYITDISQMVKTYQLAFLGYAIYGLLSYTFMYSFADRIIPALFGTNYLFTAAYCKEMFLTILVFPTALLQANLLIAMQQEKLDMWLNITSLFFNMLFCTIGMYYYKSLSVVNLSIFLSFFLFHLIQDVALFKQKIIYPFHALYFYLTSFLVILTYGYFLKFTNVYFLFFAFWSILLLLLAFVFFNIYHTKKNKENFF